MNEIRDLFPGRMRERTFQLKARRDAGAVWHEPQFVECKQCGRRATRTIWTRSLYVCPNCGYHMPIGGYYRLSLVLDHGSFRELDADLPPQDVLRFPGYPEKLTAAQNKTGLREAAVTATGRIGGVACVAAVLDSRFFMGSMSTAVGEKITRAVEYAAAKRLPLVIFSASGGARMQEGIFSLMQMAKTSAAIQRFSARGGLYVSVLTHHISGNCIPATVPATQIRFETFKKLLTYFPERKLITSMKGKDCTQATPVNMGSPKIPTFPQPIGYFLHKRN